MRASRTSPPPLMVDRDEDVSFLRRNLSVPIGLVMLAGVAVLSAALASWSVTDPSLNNATDGPVRNLLGTPGALIADSLIQIVGIGAAVILLPVAVWGWRMVFGRTVSITRRRIASWALAVLLATGLFAVISPPVTWPLPTGLGGVVGDFVLRLPMAFLGAPLLGVPAMAVAAVFGIAALAFFVHACGWPQGAPADAAVEAKAKKQAKRAVNDKRAAKRKAQPVVDDYDDDDEEEGGRFATTFGALAHFGLSAKTLVQRVLFRRRRDVLSVKKPRASASKLKEIGRQARQSILGAEDDGLEEFYKGDRVEPRWHGEDRDDEALYEADLADEDDLFRQVPEPEPARAMPVSEPPRTTRVRVDEPAPSLKPGRRVLREAQPALINLEAYEYPPLQLLAEPQATGRKPGMSADALEQNARLLEGVLEDFGVRGEIMAVRPGPVVTLYELEPAPGIKSSRVIGLADDIARSMSAISARVAVIPGKNAIGIELPNQRRETVYLRELLASQDFEKSKAKLPMCLGKTIGGEPVIADLARMPHLLVAGTTGSGKSVSINTMILSLLYRMSPDQCKLIMIDPKMLELSVYDGIPHLLSPVVTDPKKAVVALKWTVREMEDRYRNMSKLGVRNIDGYNTRVAQALKKGEVISRTVQTGFDRETGEAIYEEEELDLQPMPYIVVIVDEMADLMMVAGKDIEGAIQRLAQMARAAGIHIIMATQRPSVDVITGTIKANFPTRISFQVTSKIDSRTILGEQGAEQLLGMGDMLYMAGGGRIQRVHGPFVADGEVEDIVAHLKCQGSPEYLDQVTNEDEQEPSQFEMLSSGDDDSNDLYDKAVAVVLRDRKASTSYIQRRLSIGYNRAASIIERMEQEGVVGSANHAGKREILVPEREEYD
ncbi:MAG: cell division protein FtsK [Hyphomicrobiales bacterium]|nr:MAG: cell division protein FtsK [Hyphomicrobiales bacterium]